MKTRGQIRDVEGRKDISNGKEKYPIPVFCPEHISLPSFEYITTHSTSNAFNIPADRLGMKGCQCDDGKCDSSLCECVKYSRKIDENIECGENCYCNEKCKNRKFSTAVLPRMYLKYGRDSHGFGVFAVENIPEGKMIASYVGEIAEIQKHTPINTESTYTWLVEKSQSQVSNSKVEIDSTKKGNVSRFFNHSCKPNLKSELAFYGKYRMPYPIFLANRNITKDEELTINYGKHYFSMIGILCKCGECDGNVL